MAQLEGGWPLGLQPLNVRVGLIRRSLDFSGSLSFNTLNTCSPTSSLTSSDLDTESTGSFFHERRSTTLGTLIGITTILDLSNRQQKLTIKEKKSKKSHIYKAPMACLSLCLKSHPNSTENNTTTTPSLGHFLEVERRERNRTPPIAYEVEGFPLENRSGFEHAESCSLFSNGSIAPPPPMVQREVHLDLVGSLKSRNKDGYWFPFVISCIR